MEMLLNSVEVQLLTVLLLPLIAAICAKAITHKDLRDASILVVSASLCVLTFYIIKQAWAYGVVYQMTALTILNGSLTLGFAIEPLGMLFMAVVSLLWFVTTLYTIGYVRGNGIRRQGTFFCFFALSIAATLIIAMAQDLLTLFVGYEILTLATFPLIGHMGGEAAKKAGRTYLGILMGTSVLFFLPAIILIYQTTGSLAFTKGGLFANADISPLFGGVILALCVFGVAKAAVMPLHRWLPAAMVAPTPVSALLHAVAVVKAGVFTIVKIMVYIFGYEWIVLQYRDMAWTMSWLTYIAAFTIIAASVVALYQDNLKKRLAYSTIGQLSYVILAAATFAPLAIVAAIFHIVAHAFSKITLFFAAGAIATASGKKYISQLDGIGHRMPWTMGAFTVGALSMIAVPPTVGFISKWYMFSGAFSNGNYMVVVTLVVSTVLNAMYFLPIIFRAFFVKETDKPKRNHGEAPWPMVLALVFTAAMAIILFVFPDWALTMAASVLIERGQ